MLVVFLLGLILGSLHTVVFIYAGLAFSPQIKRTTNQVASSLKEKGKILEPENEEFSNWAESLPTE